MNRLVRIRTFLFFIIAFSLPELAGAQLSAPGSGFTEETSYTATQGTDSIYIFCSEENVNAGELTVHTNLSGTKTFTWERFDKNTIQFEPYFSEDSDNPASTITDLADGCYRVTITKGDTTEVYRAWVLNDWYTASTEVSESNCDYFQLNGSFNSAQLAYYDLSDTSQIELLKNIQVEWDQGATPVSQINNPQIDNPPTRNTDYTYKVSDRFGCGTESTVTYQSIVTKASFTVDGNFNSGNQQGEAPLDVTFTNTSENGTPGQFEWFFFRDINQIKQESANSNQPIDSIMFVAYDDNVVYTYENTGTYMVKLVSKNVSAEHTCTDTFYMKDYIVTDSSYFEVPNVFTPNGDGTNDDFVVKFWSMQNVKITIVNRWGRTVHSWQKSNVQGFEGTWAESVWDGKIGGRDASPGVYYYVAEGLGRDGQKRWAHGFFHLFRGKN